MTNLCDRECAVCRADTPTASEDMILRYLRILSGWVRDGDVIRKRFSFSSFKEAMAFLNKVAELAETENHHPNMGIHRYKHVDVSFTTHAVKGLTENDFIMAAKVDRLKR